MTSPEPTPERIDELLAGAQPQDRAERETLALMRQVRDVDGDPSAALRNRVREMGSTAPASRERWFERVSLTRRGLFTTPRLAIAGGVAVLALAAVVAIPLTDGGSTSDDALSEIPVEQSIEPRSGGVADNALEPGGDAAAAVAPESEAVSPPGFQREKSAVPGDAIAPGPDPGRPQEVRVETVVQVADVSQLSKASASAMKRVRELGGFTVSSQYSVPGGEQGSNQLLFKVPSGRVEEALEGFSEIGSITSQNASLVDLGAELSSSQLQITKRRERVRALREDLKKNPDDATLAAQLNSAERQLAQLIERRKKIQQRAQLATINLTLTTAGPAVTTGDENRFIAAFSRSAERLGVVLEWLISAAVFLVPIGLLAWLGLALARGARGRNSRRLMDAV